jgi:importin-5
MSNTDWRYPNAAIMALSQVGEYIEEVEQVKPIMDMVLKYYDNPNPRIRHSVCHCIGQISDDMNPKVQELYYEKTL